MTGPPSRRRSRWVERNDNRYAQCPRGHYMVDRTERFTWTCYDCQRRDDEKRGRAR